MNVINATSEPSISDILSYIIYFAAEEGYIDIIQFILFKLDITNTQSTDIIQHQSHKSITLNKSITTKAIYIALHCGRLEILKLLLPLPHDDPTLMEDAQYMYGAVKHVDVIKFLLSEIPGVDILKTARSVSIYASSKGSIATVQYLISTFQGKIDFSYGLVKAANWGYFNIVKMLLELPNINAGYCKNQAIRDAAQKGYFNIVKVLAERRDVDVSVDDDYVLQTAAYHGDLDAVKFLVGLRGVSANACDNRTFKNAARRGHLDVVKFLLTLPGVDPTANDNEAVMLAVTNGHEEVVKFLVTVPGVVLHSVDAELFKPYRRYPLEAFQIWLRYSGVTASSINEQFLWKAIDLIYNLDFVKLLIEFPGVDLSFDNYSVVRRAAQRGRVSFVRFLVDLPGIDKPAVGHNVLLGAIFGGKVELVKWLLDAWGVDASAGNSMAIRVAAEYGYLEIGRLLLGRAGVDVTAENNEAFFLAAERGYIEFVQLLLDNVRDGNELVGMVANLGAEEFVKMFGEFDLNASENELIAARQRVLDKLRSGCEGL
ncbi:hypothetical protein HDU76_009250 [Blyttiomyces sp. JEL0837]|nr:hypothetical protein HDU76_009250 [Blyttiomyces sp. JEL0837]